MIITKKEFPNFRSYSMDLCGRPLTLEVGKLAELANAAVLVKYGETVFHPYAGFERLEEDRLCWYLVRPGQRVVIPKSVGDGAQVRAFLEERLAAAKEASALPREAEQRG